MSPNKNSSDENNRNNNDNNTKKPKLCSGDQVRLKSERDKLGVIMGNPNCMAEEFWYQVNFGGGNSQTHPEYNLEIYQAGRTIDDLLITGSYGNKNTLSKLITFTKIRYPLKKNIYSFKASRTEFHEYQLKPVLKFIDSQDQRLLIADEVGLGKTIEAGYILQEQKARYDMDRVLVVCPASLIEKWKIEMESKFQEDFTIMKAEDIRDFLRKLDEKGDLVKLRGICSLQALRGEQILREWEAASPPLDMVIIDEGHHLRNPTTRNHKLGITLSETADAMLMLTATPVHLGNQDLFYLLRVLNSEEFDNFEIFKHRLEANKLVLKALRLSRKVPPDLAELQIILQQMLARNTHWFQENPIYIDLVNRIEQIDTKNREHIIELQRDLNRLNLLSHILTRTRKRDVNVKSNRVPQIIRPKFTKEEMDFYNAVTDFVIAKYAERGLGAFGGFIAIMPQRQVASCIPAMFEYYTKQFTEVNLGGLDEEMSDVNIEDYEEDLKNNQPVTTEYLNLLTLIRENKLKGVDSKYDALIKTIKELEEAEPERKIIIFSYFKKTLEYLSNKLDFSRYRNIVISGEYKREERNLRIQQFKNDPAIKIMLTSEVGSEGLDFQFCHIMVNYDLPWNPMVVE
ncbi:MAG: DEAD/DEAH box helicase, partial [Atribacterota bacterium]|nr:DEAD/DEAH box helicase [Atribacterota bacterium]